MVLLLQIYEKEKEAFFMRKRTKRMLSVLMAALMVVSIMPVTGSNNIVAKASTASAESSVVTWSAADILAAQEGDSGLVLCGSGWANNNATDDKTFEDGFSALGDNAKAGSTKAQTDGKTAAGTVPDNDINNGNDDINKDTDDREDVPDSSVDVVPTGDSSDMRILIMLMAVSGLAIGMTVAKSKNSLKAFK